MKRILIGALFAICVVSPVSAEDSQELSNIQICVLRGLPEMNAGGSMYLPARLSGYPYLSALCHLIDEGYTSLKEYEATLLEERGHLTRRREKVGYGDTEVQRVLTVLESDNAIELASVEIRLRHLENNLALLRSVREADAFEEQAFWEQWEKEHERFRTVMNPIILISVEINAHLAEEYRKLTEKFKNATNEIKREQYQIQREQIERALNRHPV